MSAEDTTDQVTQPNSLQQRKLQERWIRDVQQGLGHALADAIADMEEIDDDAVDDARCEAQHTLEGLVREHGVYDQNLDGLVWRDAEGQEIWGVSFEDLAAEGRHCEQQRWVYPAGGISIRRDDYASGAKTVEIRIRPDHQPGTAREDGFGQPTDAVFEGAVMSLLDSIAQRCDSLAEASGVENTDSWGDA